MCLGIPLRIIKVNGNTAKADLSGAEIDISIELVDDIKVGDYVLAHTGIAIEKVSEEDAMETMRLLNELLDQEKETPQP